mmetsp:Transcript_61458/g.70467  ORF Transcript_61458/g.70467 Transcript_61458/m.70467 type:complete len:237 (-) Transcript_61458:177-887(-)
MSVRIYSSLIFLILVALSVNVSAVETRHHRVSFLKETLRSGEIFKRFKAVDEGKGVFRSSAPYYDTDDSDQKIDDAAVNKLTEEGIKIIISSNSFKLKEEEQNKLTDKGISYNWYQVEDFHPPSVQQLKDAAGVINAGITDNKKSLIYCGHGTGRTGAFATAWEITQKTSLKDALTVITTSTAEKPDQVKNLIRMALDKFPQQGELKAKAEPLLDIETDEYDYAIKIIDPLETALQ